MNSPVTEEFESKLVSAPREKTGPAYLLGERQSYMRRLNHRLGLETPTIKELQKHAERFGSTQVVETAAELGYGYDACLRLQDFCDRVDQAEYRKAHPRGRLPKITLAEKRIRELLGLEEDDEH
jgi:hypothetical protein